MMSEIRSPPVKGVKYYVSYSDELNEILIADTCTYISPDQYFIKGISCTEEEDIYEVRRKKDILIVYSTGIPSLLEGTILYNEACDSKLQVIGHTLKLTAKMAYFTPLFFNSRKICTSDIRIVRIKGGYTLLSGGGNLRKKRYPMSAGSRGLSREILDVLYKEEKPLCADQIELRILEKGIYHPTHRTILTRLSELHNANKILLSHKAKYKGDIDVKWWIYNLNQ